MAFVDGDPVRTAALVESLPLCRIKGRAPNVFFSILKAGSHIPPHTGVTNVRSVVGYSINGYWSKKVVSADRDPTTVPNARPRG